MGAKGRGVRQEYDEPDRASATPARRQNGGGVNVSTARGRASVPSPNDPPSDAEDAGGAPVSAPPGAGERSATTYSPYGGGTQSEPRRATTYGTPTRDRPVSGS